MLVVLKVEPFGSQQRLIHNLVCEPFIALGSLIHAPTMFISANLVRES